MPEITINQNELNEGEKQRFELPDKDITATKWEGKVFAFNSKCPHRKGPIFMGKLRPNSCIMCPSHRIIFSLIDGHVISNPIPESMKDYHDTTDLEVFQINKSEEKFIINY
ncbi:Rieske [2Fe-2S] domain protein [mine drainage metagenome]|uniref:Rieske [2Fe-2S] domain protein n=1 Tax=mine drainage metagenome TaxID=410659 RepID=T1CJW5_9ZZZZ